MSVLDWFVLLASLFGIVAYGSWKTRKNTSMREYFVGDSSMRWWHVGLSVMATQASAITFLSLPGQAYMDGMKFAQAYFGLPLAMIIISVFFIPVFFTQNASTAYELLEKKLGLPNRLLAAGIFLLQRGLAAGITIYAPAIILSHILGWSLHPTILVIGVLVIIYTVTGGTKAVAETQKHQMAVIFAGLAVALVVVFLSLPDSVTPLTAISIAGSADKLTITDWSFDINNRYTVWSGLIGGLFLSLSYFGTDQSQVQRYLGGKSTAESKLGLIFNAIVKIPMQVVILLIGAMVYVVYLFYGAPLTFNPSTTQQIAGLPDTDPDKQSWLALLKYHNTRIQEQQTKALELSQAIQSESPTLPSVRNELLAVAKDVRQVKDSSKVLLEKMTKKRKIATEANDTDYIFLSFILQFLPIGSIGLLLSVIFSAAMSSTSGELSALASTSTIDFYQRIFVKDASEEHYLLVSRISTFLWGVIAIGFAMFSSLFENLIQAVNIIGSIFYGTVLGLFCCALFLRNMSSKGVFAAGVIAQSIVIYLSQYSNISFLWYNLIGCAIVVVLGALFSLPRWIEGKTES